MSKMTETEKQARRDAIIQNSFSSEVQSIRDWQQMLLILDYPSRSRVLILEALKVHIDNIIREIER